MKAGKTQVKNLHPQLQKLDSKLKDAAKLYEQQFLREMVKAMRKSVSHSALTKPGMAEGIYREQLDDKYVEGWMKSGGTGFADLIYNDLVEKFYPQLGSAKPQVVRPVNLSDRYQGISKSIVDKQTRKQTFNIQLGPQQTQKSYLQIPWQGKFEKEFQLDSGQKVAMFSHPFGLKSVFVFRGELEPGLLGKTLQQGENFAQLNPEQQNMTWQIEDADSRKDPSAKENKSFN